MTLTGNMFEQREVWYSGHVQGVGFRYQTLQVAKGFSVTGQVENLPDGRVHLIAEGTSGELDAFLDAVADALDSYIRHQETRTHKASGNWRGFTIAG